MPDTLPLKVAEHKQRILVDRGIEGSHELFASNPNLGKDPFDILFNSFNACIYTSYNLITQRDRFIQINLKVLFWSYFIELDLRVSFDYLSKLHDA